MPHFADKTHQKDVDKAIKNNAFREIERLHRFDPLTMRGLVSAITEFRRQDGQGDTVHLADNQLWLTDTAYYAMCTAYPESFPEEIMLPVLAALGHYDFRPVELCEHLPAHGCAPADCELVVCQCSGVAE